MYIIKIYWTKTLLLCGFSVIFVLFGCKHDKDRNIAQLKTQKNKEKDLLVDKPEDMKTPAGMVWVQGSKFMQGANENDELASQMEKPAHPVRVDGFFMDITEVTNKEFARFVKETGYKTIAERTVDWKKLKEQLPPGTPRPTDSVLQPGSLIFNREAQNVENLNDYTQWWVWKIGANWQHPSGPESTIENKGNYPVVHIAYQDAMAYCEWAHRRLPTEAEWEAAAHGDMKNNIFTWGDDHKKLIKKANTWRGEFPITNIPEDGYKYAAPVKSFDPNSIGLYDMAGNVWEITNDWFDVSYYKSAVKEGEIGNPLGSKKSFNPNNPYEKEKVIKGGSFLCNASYCASYRISARMGQSLDSASDHVGFRTVLSPDMIEN